MVHTKDDGNGVREDRNVRHDERHVEILEILVQIGFGLLQNRMKKKCKIRVNLLWSAQRMMMEIMRGNMR